jgi:hypothetical protein
LLSAIATREAGYELIGVDLIGREDEVSLLVIGGDE